MTSGAPSRNRKAAYSKASLLLCSLFLSLLLGEGLLQLFPPCQTRHLLMVRNDNREYYVGHPDIGYLLKPSIGGVLWGCDFRAAFHTDARGFRNRSAWPDKAEFVAIGDSLTFGFGVEDEEAWPSIFARALPQSSLLNLGLMGACPEQYLRLYKTFGAKMHPRVLLVGLFLGNDFHEAPGFDRGVKSNAGGNYLLSQVPPLRFREHPLQGIKGLLSRYSYLYNLVREIMNTYHGRHSSDRRLFSLRNGHRLVLFPTRLAEAVTMGQPGHEEFQQVFRPIDRMSSIARENGTHMLVIFQPSKEEIYLPLLGEPPSDPGGPLRLALQKEGIDCLDLTPAYKCRAMAGEQLFFEADGHPNRTGYRVIAEEVLAYLSKQNHNFEPAAEDESQL
jgi:lysophospholipase L1-like esterase